MNRIVPILVAHDLAVAVKNKTLVLLLCIPLFVYGTLLLIDRSDAPTQAVALGFLAEEPCDPTVLAHLQSVPELVSLRRVADRKDGERLLRERAIDGLLLPADHEPPRLTVVVVRRDAPASMAIVQRLAALQIALEGDHATWLSELHALQPDAIELQSMPTWILMVVLLVAFFVLPTQVAEEKERQLLLGLLQTPMREGQWLVAKLAYGMILMFASVFALQGLSLSLRAEWNFLATLALGCFCFGALGITLGLLCRNQASARTFGVICYLPLLLPAALSDVSQNFRLLAPFLPSHAFFAPVQSILLDREAAAACYPVEWLTLAVLGGLACLGSYRLVKARWLM